MPPRGVVDVLCLAVLALIVVHAGSEQLQDWVGPAGSLTNDLFVPAVMMNAGRGFSNVEPSELPELRAFLDFRVQEFDLALVTEETADIALHPYQAFHRYLIYTVAAVWRLFGVNWDAVKLLILFYFVLAAWCVYGICRLGMNPVFSLWAAASFAYVPAVLWTLPILRDFVKAPFILAVLLLLGLMARRRLAVRRYFGLAVLTGALLGVGMGFRRDMMVFVPLCVAFLYACRLAGDGYAVKARVAATSLLLGAFIFAGLPIHRALREQGFVAAHDTIMGFASYSDHELGVIRPASYEKHYLLNDLYCTLRAHDGARRGVTLPAEDYRQHANDPEFDNVMKRAYVLGMAKAFPADMLTRAYAAVLRICTGVVRSSHFPAYFVESSGLWFAGAVLLLVAGASPMRAWLMLALLCYFCGITSLQFAFRHVFHMSFVPFFFAGLGVHLLGAACLRLLGVVDATGNTRLLPGGPARFLVCMTLWGLLTATAFYAPLQAARAWQHRQTITMRDHYVRAPLDSIAHVTLTWDERALFAPIEGRSCHECQTMDLIYSIRTRFLVAKFVQVDEPLDIYAVYEWQGGAGNFSSPFTYRLLDADAPTDLRYYFAVHEPTTCDDWSRFVGISMPLSQARFFKDFHQVADIESLGFLVNMMVPEDETLFIAAQWLDMPWAGAPWRPYPMFRFNVLPYENTIRHLLAADEHEEAAALAGELLEQRPYSIQFTFLLAEALERGGATDQAYQQCMALLDRFPECFVLYAQLDRFFEARGGARRRADEWAALLERRPELYCAEAYLERARQELTGAAQFIYPLGGDGPESHGENDS